MRIDLATLERKRNYMTTEGDPLDVMPEAESLHVEEARQRFATRTGRTVSNDRVMPWLDTWGLDKEIPSPECK